MRKTKNNYVPAEYGGYLFPKSCLPDILPGDRGKVLTVNQSETEAIWAQAQGGSGIFWIVSTEIEMDDDNVIRLDKTFLEIYTAMLNRTLCVIVSDAWAEPPDYSINYAVVTAVAYDQGTNKYVVYAGGFSFECSTINDYPEAS